MVALIDYGAGNLKSVENALVFLGQECCITCDRDEIMTADRVILPGVGSFGEAMANIKSKNLVKTIEDVIGSTKPFLGICLGLQLLFEYSEESPGIPGLGIYKGGIKRFSDEVLKVPQIGWNSLDIKKSGGIFKGIPQNSYVYFVHSYYLKAEDLSIVASMTDYVTLFHSAIEDRNVSACQFHPEKSGKTGLRILKNFCDII
ncbi:MAG: imidazole glycerol phosphate synthase subunit HisH [Clostridiales bacterium]|jgi:glutamine amidotransferase|nr:imidazole glycerol phosphate synthase subunit HisH [Clostridiales bacterium]